ncbi:MAG: hypothetical protein GX433_10910 [Deltaproteobacteria bacterium]|jgi:hypothetical protein|uniref:Uncharacterized protein n=2 Tax=Desulforhabdus amnigena TaxID=40218 RepID=A0A9W6FV13_9BACT|nr:hypothetical protein [Deltaproteobacteria bacterium]GLI35394.1 hypothetical protein DAMNIGENAA_28270 [Desulforhabdus amnigena]
MFLMEKIRCKTSTLDYTTLRELAQSRNVKYVEARGLDMRKGVRFHKDGSDWIAVDAGLPVEEKIRTLGYLLENEPASMAARIGMKGDFSETSSLTPVLTLCCS